jgi:cellulose synthase/poly-beta-1,6-N-acetylglucosamine synthase-like glycosyltransferase
VKRNTKNGGMAWWLFWSSLGLILYTYLVFPGLVVLRAILKSRTVSASTTDPDAAQAVTEDSLPTVSFIIAAYNEAKVIAEKIENALSLDYPKHLIEVIVASDGSNDGTNEIVADHPSPLVRLVPLPRQGKNRTINQAVEQASGEILVFTDADSMFAPQTLRFLIAPFADPKIGGVAGSYRYVKDGQGAGGERAYWKFDQKLKELQSNGGNLVGATGHIYAIRRCLFSPVPQGVTDDAYISRGVLGKHKRLIFEPRAVAYGPIADSSGEFRRKVRITTRGLKVVWEQRYLLNPIEYGFYSVQLFTHKVLRRLMFIPMLATMISAAALWKRGWFYRLATIGQIAVHSAAVVGYTLNRTRLGKSKLLSFPYYLDMTNLASAAALRNLLRGESRDVWDAERAMSDDYRLGDG